MPDPDQVIEEPAATDLVAVMRKHVYDALVALDSALTVSGAQDIIDKNREGRPAVKASHLTRELGKAYEGLIQYIGVEDGEQLDAQPIQEDERLSGRSSDPS